MVCVIEAISAAVTDKVAIYRFAEACFQSHDLPVSCTGCGVAAEGTVDANGRGSLVVPAPSFKPGRLIGINSCGTDIDQVASERAFQGAVLIASEVSAVADLHRSQVTITRKVLIESAASPAMDAAVHFVLDKGA